MVYTKDSEMLALGVTTSHYGKSLGECPDLDPAKTAFSAFGALLIDWKALDGLREASE